MHYRRRGSRKNTDIVAAIQFNGFQELPTDPRRKRPVMPEWLPPIDLYVETVDGDYANTEGIDPTPSGQIWSMGNIFARFGMADGHKDCKPGDYIVRFPDGTVIPMTKAELHSQYKAI